jgi:hypothetical protein
MDICCIPQVPVYLAPHPIKPISKMDPSLIAKLELEELQMKEWECNLMLKPSLDDTVPEAGLLNYVTPPEDLSKKGTSGYPSGYVYRFPACYNGFNDWENSNLTSATVASNMDSNEPTMKTDLVLKAIYGASSVTGVKHIDIPLMVQKESTM